MLFVIDRTISHYKILKKLGEVGMRIVYKDHDTTLDGDLALAFPEGDRYSNRGQPADLDGGRPRYTNNHNINLP